MKIFLQKYILLLNILWSYCSISTKEIYYHNKWLIVNITCREEADLHHNPVKDVHVKRSISYDAFRHDIALNEVQPLDELYNVTGYNSDSQDSSTHKTKNGNYTDNPDSNMPANSTWNSELAGPIVYSNSSKDYEHVLNNSSFVIGEGSSSAEDGHEISKASVSINCDSLELDSNIINPVVKHLRLKSTGNLILTSEWANNLKNLLVLNIHSENGLTIPSDNCTWVPNSLTTLDLSQTTLKRFSLSNCSPNLRVLLLQGTSLENLTLCVEHLEELDAAWNLLQGEGVNQVCEDATANVKILKLHNNELDYWSSCGWPSLTRLELQKNEIRNANFSSCVSHNLVEINLSYNKLKEAPHKYPPKLNSIDLSHNHIEKTTHLHRMVQEVDLSHNSLTNLTRGTFRSASQLLSLDLSYNQLTIIYGHDFSGLHALRYLDLSHNSITQIRHEAFHPLRFILSLNINHNKLHQLDARLLANLPNNLQFQIHNNPWRCGCHILSTLSQASKSCKPHCHQQPELTCRERDTEVPAQNILRQCLAAVQDSETVSPFHVKPDLHNSDEDTSEERKKSTPISYYMIIPTVALFVGVPLIALAVRTIYLNRKNMKRCCNCLANTPNVRWTQQRNIDRESDSETEF